MNYWNMEYDFISEFERGIAIVRKENKYGAILKNGMEIIPIEHTYLSSFKDGYANFVFGSFSGKIDLAGSICVMDRLEIVPLPKEYIWGTDFINGYSIVLKDGLYGIINRNFEEVVSLRYDAVRNFQSQVACVKSQSKYGLVDLAGKEILPPKYDCIGNFFNDVAIVKLGIYWGVINKYGKEVVPLSYSKVEIYKDFIVADHKKFDFRGNEISASHKKDYSKTSLWSNKLNKFSQEINGVTLYGIQKGSGEIIVPPRFTYIGTFDYDGMAYVSLPDMSIKVTWLDSIKRNAYINRQGILHLKFTEEVYVEGGYGVQEKQKRYEYIPIPSIYEWGVLNDKDYIKVMKGGEWGLIKADGTELVPPQWDNVCLYADNKAMVLQQGLWSIYLIEEKKQILKYFAKLYWCSNYWIAQKEGEARWEILTEKGEIFQSMKNQPISCLGNLWVVAKRKTRFWGWDYGIVDSNENIIISIDKNSITVSPKGYFIINNNEKEEKFNENGSLIVFNGDAKIILPSKYTMAADFENGVARVKSNLWGIIDTDLNEIVFPKYQRISPFVNGFSICNDGIIINEKGQEIYHSERPID